LPFIVGIHNVDVPFQSGYLSMHGSRGILHVGRRLRFAQTEEITVHPEDLSLAPNKTVHLQTGTPIGHLPYF
jgi:hypothetical protein